jgi:hypothetical protein
MAAMRFFGGEATKRIAFFHRLIGPAPLALPYPLM